MKGETPSRGSVWSNRFIASAIFQGAVITLLTASFVGMQLLFSPSVNIIQILSLSFEGPAKWIFLGYIFYMILIVAIATTAIFYNHLEVNLQKRIRGVRSALAWANLVGMNVGGAAVTLMMVYAGLAGSGVLGVIASSGASGLSENPAIMGQFITPIAAFAGLLIIGVVAGGLAYIATYFQSKPTDASHDNDNRSDMAKIGSV
ncbi:hypothetical protein [Nitrososphaera viennensis]|uniref:Uncharacterized protein n=2 Tax=Nitrososphaera viennensis TaxID=1034015 RepID=A0A060HK95_9ARCH|nr:hypothetical protein [Nitrososphaera viennensis]AIC15898.1 conserved membrane protein of unknown function [Nitrososphaera viennensis EN76]UVS67885.1 hypothetical protein NWT39_08195 [Nitrososphaera viennensis]